MKKQTRHANKTIKTQIISTIFTKVKPNSSFICYRTEVTKSNQVELGHFDKHYHYQTAFLSNNMKKYVQYQKIQSHCSITCR